MDEIKAAYADLAAKTGDLHFIITAKRVELQALERQMAEYHKQHQELLRKANEAAAVPAEVVNPAPVAVEG